MHSIFKTRKKETKNNVPFLGIYFQRVVYGIKRRIYQVDKKKEE